MTAEASFWKHYEVDSNGCWVWNLTPDKDGYGTLKYKNKSKFYAHRAAYELAIGPIPEGLLVLHKCDNRLCINPEHLYIGTHEDNMRDVRERNRRKGDKSGNRKLTQEQVNEIRASKDNNGVLGRRYGVSRKHVYRIKRYLNWAN